jgi:MFS superfamily sulfate permease-like transporter
MFSAYTTTGSFSRSAVNNSSGASLPPRAVCYDACAALDELHPCCAWVPIIDVLLCSCSYIPGHPCVLVCVCVCVCVCACARLPLLCCTGAKTQLAGFITSMLVLFVLLVMTPVFELLPYNTMAAIIIAGVMGLVEFETAYYLLRVRYLLAAGLMCCVLLTYVLAGWCCTWCYSTDPVQVPCKQRGHTGCCVMYVTRASDSVLTGSLPLTQIVLHLTQTVLLLLTPPPTTPLLQTQLRDFIVWLVAFVVTLFAGIELGLAAAIGLALVIVIIESAFPHTAMLGRVERTTVRGCLLGLVPTVAIVSC